MPCRCPCPHGHRFFTYGTHTHGGEHHASGHTDHHHSRDPRHRRVAGVAVRRWLGLLPDRRPRPGPADRLDFGPARPNLETALRAAPAGARKRHATRYIVRRHAPAHGRRVADLPMSETARDYII